MYDDKFRAHYISHLISVYFINTGRSLIMFSLDVPSVLTMNEAILNSKCPSCPGKKFKMAAQLFKYGVLRTIQYLLHGNRKNASTKTNQNLTVVIELSKTFC